MGEPDCRLILAPTLPGAARFVWSYRVVCVKPFIQPLFVPALRHGIVRRIVGIQAVGACAVHSSVLLSAMSDTMIDRLVGGAMAIAYFAIECFATMRAVTTAVIPATAGAVAHLQRGLRHQVSQKLCPHNLVVIWFIL